MLVVKDLVGIQILEQELDKEEATHTGIRRQVSLFVVAVDKQGIYNMVVG